MLKNKNKDLKSTYFKNMLVLNFFQCHSIWTKIERSFERWKSNKRLILRISLTTISKSVRNMIYHNLFFSFPPERVRKFLWELNGELQFSMVETKLNRIFDNKMRSFISYLLISFMITTIQININIRVISWNV